MFIHIYRFLSFFLEVLVQWLGPSMFRITCGLNQILLGKAGFWFCWSAFSGQLCKEAKAARLVLEDDSRVENLNARALLRQVEVEGHDESWTAPRYNHLPKKNKMCVFFFFFLLNGSRSSIVCVGGFHLAVKAMRSPLKAQTKGLKCSGDKGVRVHYSREGWNVDVLVSLGKVKRKSVNSQG